LLELKGTTTLYLLSTMASSGLKHDCELSKGTVCTINYMTCILHNSLDDLDSNYDYSLLVTGVTGSGKSTLCNFLCCSKNAFEAHTGFASVTSKSAAATITMQGIRLKLIDTPGFCDDYETEEEHMNEFGEALVLASKGVNAICLVISAKARYTANETNTIKYMTEFPELWPYMFIFFTNAASIGANENERNVNLQANFKHPRCPDALKELMQKVKNRYVLVESVKPSQNPEAYYQTKTTQLHSMIVELNEANNHQLYTNALFRKAKEMIDKLYKEKKDAEDMLVRCQTQVQMDTLKRKEKQKIAEKAKENTSRSNLQLEQKEKEAKEKRRSHIEQLSEDEKAKEQEKAKIQEEIEKHQEEKDKLEQSLIEQERNKELIKEANKEAVEKLKAELIKERQLNEQLKGKRNRKWYTTLMKKTTGNDCVLQ